MSSNKNGAEPETGADLLHHDLKIVVIGDMAVGKTALVSRYTEKKYPEKTNPTSGVRIVYGDWGRFRFAIWDIAGRNKHEFTLCSSYLRHSGAAILVYDMFADYTFDKLVDRFVKVLNAAADPELKVIVATKSDMIGSDKERHVTREEGIDLAKKLNPSMDFSDGQSVPYFEVSSKTGENVVELFEYILNFFSPDGEPLEFVNPLPEITDSIRIDDTARATNSGCW